MTDRPPLRFRLATREDDAAIRAVLRRNVMPGAMALAFAHEPSFFASAEVEGDGATAIVGERGGAVVGMGLVARRRVYLNGEPAEVGYLSSLRADPSERLGMGLARGYAFLKRLHREMGVPFYISTIMEDNPARAVLTSGRAGLPTYHEIGRYRTLAIPLLRRRAPRLPAGLRLVDGRAIGAERLAAFLNHAGRTRQCYPRYTAEDLSSPTGILCGLGLADILVACAGDRIVGTLGCWDQVPFRQHIVTGYAGALAWTRPLVNALARVRGCLLLPRTGQTVRSLAAACLAVEGDSLAVFRALLETALAARAGDIHDVLLIGLATNDPLLPVAVEPLHIALHSRIYAVEWGDGAGAVQTLDERPAYLEVGSL